MVLRVAFGSLCASDLCTIVLFLVVLCCAMLCSVAPTPMIARAVADGDGNNNDETKRTCVVILDVEVHVNRIVLLYLKLTSLIH